jgi:hypothetical protein
MKFLIVLCALLHSAFALAQGPAPVTDMPPTWAATFHADTNPQIKLDGFNCVEVPITQIAANVAEVMGGNKMAGLLGLLLVICRTLSEVLGHSGGLLERRFPRLQYLAYPLKIVGWAIGKFGWGVPTVGAAMPVLPKTVPTDAPKA